MNELPDELWFAEHTRMRGIPDPSANDADGGIVLFPYTTEESVLLVALGVSAIAFSFVVTVSLAAMAGWSITRLTRKLRAGTLNRGKTKRVSLH